MEVEVKVQELDIINRFIERLEEEVMKLPEEDRYKMIDVILRVTERGE